MAAQLTATKGCCRRSLLACTALAKYSLPEPVSPVINKLMGELTKRATRSICRSKGGSPAERAAKAGGTAVSRWLWLLGSLGGGVADKNSNCRPPECMTAR